MEVVIVTDMASLTAWPVIVHVRLSYPAPGPNAEPRAGLAKARSWMGQENVGVGVVESRVHATSVSETAVARVQAADGEGEGRRDDVEMRRGRVRRAVGRWWRVNDPDEVGSACVNADEGGER